MITSKRKATSQSKETFIVEFQRSALRISKMTDGAFQESHLFDWPKAGDIPWKNVSEVADWVMDCAKTKGFHLRSAIVCVPRTSACLRVLELPCVAKEQLPNLVSMQTELTLGGQSENAEYDFVLLPCEDNAITQSVLLATISKTTLLGIQSIFKIANCRVEVITLGELAIGFANQRKGDAIQFLALSNGSQWDVAACQAGIAVQFQSTPIASEVAANARSISGLVHRLRSALPAWLTSYPSETPFLLADTDANANRELLDLLAAELEFEVHEVSRTECILRMAQDTSAHSMNFAAPWRAQDWKAISRKRWTKFGLFATSVAAVLMLWGYVSNVVRRGQLDALRTQIATLEGDIGQFESQRAAYRTIQQWQTRYTNWGVELTRLAKRLTAKRELYIARVQMETGEADRTPTMRLDGLASSVNEVLKFNRDFLAESERYSIQPQGIEPSIADPEFSVQFRLEAKVLGSEANTVSTGTLGVEPDE